MGGTCCGGREQDNKYKNKSIGTETIHYVENTFTYDSFIEPRL